MNYDISDETFADISYCIEVTAWLAMTHGNDALRNACNAITRQLNAAWPDSVPPHYLPSNLSALAMEHHRNDLEERWIRLSGADVNAIILSAERLQQMTPDVIVVGTEPFTETSLMLSGIARRWEDAPSCCPSEVRCSSYPECACSGGVPV
jgi:hypothetical protein